MTAPSEKTVLIVDDEPDVRLFLQTALEDAGFNVVTAADGEEALEKVKQRPPDFISCDLVMPRKSGVKFLYELRRNKEWSRIPVVIVTAHARDELGSRDLREILEGRVIQGPHVYLEKPVQADDFVNMVRRELGIEEQPAAGPTSDASALKQEIQRLLASADPEALAKAARILREQGRS